MAGASKARQKKEKKASASSNVQSSASEKAAGPSKEVTPPTPGKSPVRYDGNDDSMEVVMRDPNKSRVIVDNRRLDLSMAGWSVCGDVSHFFSFLVLPRLVIVLDVVHSVSERTCCFG